MSSKRFAPLSAAIALFILILAGCGGGGTTGGLPLATGKVDGYIYLSSTPALSAQSASRASAGPTLTTRATGGTPAVGATVRVADQTVSAPTDATGYFLLNGVAVGTHTLIVSLSGYQPLQLTVAVTANLTTRISSTFDTLTPTARKWTILVFMNADNNLEPYGVENMNQMEAVPDNPAVTVLVQFARSSYSNTINGTWTGARRYLIHHDTNTTVINSTLLEDLGPTDMGVPTTLATFIAWGEQLYPAEHYMVVLWDHGSGWRAQVLISGFTRGISYDDTTGHYLRTTDLPSGLTAPQPIDIVAMDACLMQMIEVDYQIRGQCRYVVASEDDVPGDGYPYQTFLADLASNPAMTPAAFADDIAQQTVNYYAASQPYICHSVVDTTQLDGAATALGQFAAAMIPVAGSYPTGFATARNTADAYSDNEFKDLVDYATQVQANVSDSTVHTTGASLITAVKSAVVSSYAGSGHPGSHGLSIWVPTAANYTATATTYTPLALSGVAHWESWLAAQKQ